MAQQRNRVFEVVEGAVLTVAGVVDVAQSEALHALRVISIVPGRTGARGVMREGHGTLQERGSAMLKRWTSGPDHHMEVMARRVARAAKRTDGR